MDLHGRPGAVHGGVRRRRVRRVRHHIGSGPRRHGRRRGADHAGHARRHRERFPARCRTHQGDRHLVGGGRRGDGDRTDGRRLAAESLLVGVGVPDQPPRRHRGPVRRCFVGAELPRPESRRLDPTGALLSVVAVASVLWAVIEGPERGWTSPAVLAAFIAGALLLTVFIAWQRRAMSPMLPLRIFRHRALAAGDLLVLVGAFALIGTLFVAVQHFQFVLGYSAGQTGLRLGPAALALLVAGPLAGVLAPRLGMRAVSAVGLALLSASAAVLATTGVTDGYGRALVTMLLLGAGAGFVITVTSDAIVGSLPETDLGVGSATNSAAIQLGAATGVAVIGSLLSDRYRSELDDTPAPAPESLLDSAMESLGTALALAERLPGEAGAVFAEAARHAFVDGMGPALFAGAGVTAVGVLLALLLAPSRDTNPTPIKDPKDPS
ncbi:MFS transporter [Streptomyces sp. SHP22-7]|nr:MFS transporter [Streptomyces sp. SHP22-7]